MKKEFVPYDRALRLKALGFDEPCFAVFELIVVGNTIPKFRYNWESEDKLFNHNKDKSKYKDHDWYWSAPTFSQAFRWFREKHGIGGYVRRGSNKMHEHLKENGFSVADYEWRINKTDGTHTSGHGMKDTYEEAELACLDKLIEYCQKLK